MYVDDSLLSLEVPLHLDRSLSRRTTPALICANKYNYRLKLGRELVCAASRREIRTKDRGGRTRDAVNIVEWLEIEKSHPARV